MTAKISKESRTMEIEIDADMGLLNAIQTKLLEDRNVEIAYITQKHPLTEKPKFFIRTKKGSAASALKKALKNFIKETEEFEQEFDNIVMQARSKL